MSNILIDVLMIVCSVCALAKIINFRLSVIEIESQKEREKKRQAHIKAISGNHDDAVFWDKFYKIK